MVQDSTSRHNMYHYVEGPSRAEDIIFSFFNNNLGQRNKHTDGQRTGCPVPRVVNLSVVGVRYYFIVFFQYFGFLHLYNTSVHHSA